MPAGDLARGHRLRGRLEGDLDRSSVPSFAEACREKVAAWARSDRPGGNLDPLHHVAAVFLGHSKFTLHQGEADPHMRPHRVEHRLAVPVVGGASRPSSPRANRGAARRDPRSVPRYGCGRPRSGRDSRRPLPRPSDGRGDALACPSAPPIRRRPNRGRSRLRPLRRGGRTSRTRRPALVRLGVDPAKEDRLGRGLAPGVGDSAPVGSAARHPSPPPPWRPSPAGDPSPRPSLTKQNRPPPPSKPGARRRNSGTTRSLGAREGNLEGSDSGRPAGEPSSARSSRSRTPAAS